MLKVLMITLFGVMDNNVCLLHFWLLLLSQPIRLPKLWKGVNESHLLGGIRAYGTHVLVYLVIGLSIYSFLVCFNDDNEGDGNDDHKNVPYINT